MARRKNILGGQARALLKAGNTLYAPRVELIAGETIGPKVPEPLPESSFAFGNAGIARRLRPSLKRTQRGLIADAIADAKFFTLGDGEQLRVMLASDIDPSATLYSVTHGGRKAPTHSERGKLARDVHKPTRRRAREG